MSDEVKEIRQKMRAELLDWIEARIPQFMETFAGEPPDLPMVEDFRLVVCVTDGADAEAADYYPSVDSGSSHHRQVGLMEQASRFLAWRAADDDE